MCGSVFGSVIDLDCAVCGGPARGRQWHNRDTGFGLCLRCADWLESRGTSSDEMRECYGLKRIHYCVEED